MLRPLDWNQCPWSADTTCQLRRQSDVAFCQLFSSTSCHGNTAMILRVSSPRQRCHGDTRQRHSACHHRDSAVTGTHDSDTPRVITETALSRGHTTATLRVSSPRQRCHGDTRQRHSACHHRDNAVTGTHDSDTPRVITETALSRRHTTVTRRLRYHTVTSVAWTCAWGL